MKKAVSVLLCAVFIFGFVTVDTCALGTSAKAHVLMDADTGIILSENNKDQKLKMASTTKIMTTLLALEAAEKEDTIVTFSKEMVAEGSSMYLKIGDKVRLSDLASGMMMASGNDAANAVGLTLSRSFEGFATLMNNRAGSIGMTNTNFVTPSGLDDEEHYSSAFDMALLMAEAMKNKSFCEISASSSRTVEFICPEDKVTSYPNHNRLLSSYEYCTGGKTGYTKAAGRCLVTSGEKDGVRLIAVTLDAPNDWADHKALYEYGFSMYTRTELSEAGESYKVKLAGGEDDFFTASADESLTISVPANRILDIESKVYLPSFVFAPVRKGDIVGKITYTLDGKELAYTFIKATGTVNETPKPNFFARLITAIFNRD